MATLLNTSSISQLLFFFFFFFFCHVKHNSNKVVDALAKKAEDGVELQVWLEALPENIVPLALFKVH